MLQTYTNVTDIYKCYRHIQMLQTYTNVTDLYKCCRNIRMLLTCTYVTDIYKCYRHIQMLCNKLKICTRRFYYSSSKFSKFKVTDGKDKLLEWPERSCLLLYVRARIR